MSCCAPACCRWCAGPLPVRPPGVGGAPRRTCSKACRNRMNRAIQRRARPGAVAEQRREAYALAIEAGLQPRTAASFWSPASVRRFIALAGVDFTSGSRVPDVHLGMNNAAASAFTHSTYSAAVAAVKKAKASAGTVTWDAGEGFTGRAYWCTWRKRVVVETLTPDGTVMH